jgi:hypothetical protein
MKSRGYSEGQIRAMSTIMSLCAEWFDHSIVTVKDNKKHVFWDTEGDDDMLDMMAYRAYEEISEADSSFPELDDMENEGEPEADYLTEEWKDYEDDDD